MSKPTPTKCCKRCDEEINQVILDSRQEYLDNLALWTKEVEERRKETASQQRQKIEVTKLFVERRKQRKPIFHERRANGRTN